MPEWIKEHKSFLISVLVIISVVIYLYGCESKVRSITDGSRLINRQELQLELDQFVGTVRIRMADLAKQDQLRTLILENALILVQGQPFNPLGLLTGVSAVYGFAQAGRNAAAGVKKVYNKKRVNNG